MIVVRVYLKSGQHFDVCAEGVECKYNGLTGALASFNYTGAVSGIPVYLDIGEVEAVVQLKACGGDDDEQGRYDKHSPEVVRENHHWQKNYGIT